ncbi:MAG: adenosylcobinamide-GDP ribazoletransferase [Anaerolineae bacterium]|nr:adenosylcobinamide-GDP ribazoletransferase [Anaerolineae bacterium]
MKYLRLAVSFLTVLPTRQAADYQPGDNGRAAVYFPWVGLLLAVLVIAANSLLRWFLPLPLTAVLTLALWAGLTGFLHLDGLADCADALPLPVPIERRLEILKDSRVGSFALVSLILFLYAKTAALYTLQTLPFWQLAWILANTIVLSRWMMILLTATQASARPGGMADDFKLGLTRKTIILSSLLPVLLCITGIALIGLPAVVVILLLAVLTMLIARTARRRLGGITGDVIGMTVEVCELFALVLFTIR